MAIPLAMIPALPAVAAPIAGQNVLYTTDADFDGGALQDVNHDAPNSDQLQLDRTSTFFPYVNVAASARGTMVRIDVDTGQIVGEWASAPDGRGKNPSRTTVDKLGNTWLSNRNEAEAGKGSVTRIGVIVGGSRVDGSGAPDANGAYLAGPFAYNTCQDRDNDGRIATSRGLGDIRPWTNAGGADNNGGVTTAADECVINYTRVTGSATRTVAVDANNDLWTGGLDQDHEKVSGATGIPVPGTQINYGCGGYGGLVDKAGTLWSALNGGQLLRYVPSTNSGACLDGSHGNYGLGLDPNTGEIWHTFVSGNRVAKLAPDGTVLGSFPHGSENAQGVAVDRDGNVWVAHALFGATTVGHLRTDGTYVGNVTLPGGNGPTGVAVDSNGKVWVTNINSNNAMRIDPTLGGAGGGGFAIGAVDLTVDLGAGAGPYNYSDMTGSVLGEITAPVGTWSVVQDGGAAGVPWGKVTWNTEAQGSVPAGTSITVEARASDSEAGLAGQPFTAVANATTFALTGRYIEVRATLMANAAGDSPVLSDVRIQTSQRTGVFSCRARALDVAGIVVAEANGPDVPCADDTETVANVNLNAGILNVKASAVHGSTNLTPDNQLLAPVAGDKASAHAQVDSTKISSLLAGVELGVITSDAAVTCVAGPGGLQPQFSGSSNIANLKINGVPVVVGSAPLTIPLVIGSLKLNSQVISGNTITQRAVVLDTVLADVVIAEARANFEGKPASPGGNPCQV